MSKANFSYNFNDLVRTLKDKGMNPEHAMLLANVLIPEKDGIAEIEGDRLAEIASKYDTLSWDTVRYIEAIMVPENVAMFEDLEGICASIGVRPEVVKREKTLPAYRRMVSEIAEMNTAELSARFRVLFVMKNIEFLRTSPELYLKMISGMPREVVLHLVMDVRESQGDSVPGGFDESCVTETVIDSDSIQELTEDGYGSPETE